MVTVLVLYLELSSINQSIWYLKQLPAIKYHAIGKTSALTLNQLMPLYGMLVLLDV